MARRISSGKSEVLAVTSIEQNHARVAQKRIGPGENNAASDDANDGIEPGPAEEFTRSQCADRQHTRNGIRQHVNIRGPQIEIMMMSVSRFSTAAVRMMVMRIILQ